MSAPPDELDAPEILARAVHDLNNPLAVLRATLDWLESELASEGGERLDALRDAGLALGRLGAIIADVHTLARIQRGEETDKTEVDLAVLARDAVAALSARASARGVAFTLETVPSPVHGEPASLARAVSAFAEHAMREAPPAAVVRVGVAPDGDRAVMEISDAGDGAPPGSRRDLVGSGIAALVAHAIVRAHQGTARVSAGSTMVRIRLDLPLNRQG